MGEGGDIVVLVHGLGRSSRSIGWLARGLQVRGLATILVDYRSRRDEFDTSVAATRLVIAQAASSARHVHMVAHSLGSLIALAALACPPENLGAVVLLGPPLGGSEVADLIARLRLGALLGRNREQLLPRPVAAIAPALHGRIHVVLGDRPWLPLPKRLLPWPNDGKVSHAASLAQGLASYVVLPTGHTRMLRDRRVLRHVAGIIEGTARPVATSGMIDAPERRRERHETSPDRPYPASR